MTYYRFKARVKLAARTLVLPFTSSSSGKISRLWFGVYSIEVGGSSGLYQKLRVCAAKLSERSWVTSLCLHSSIHLQLTERCSFHYTCLLWSRRKCLIRSRLHSYKWRRRAGRASARWLLNQSAEALLSSRPHRHLSLRRHLNLLPPQNTTRQRLKRYNDPYTFIT